MGRERARALLWAQLSSRFQRVRWRVLTLWVFGQALSIAKRGGPRLIGRQRSRGREQWERERQSRVGDRAIERYSTTAASTGGERADRLDARDGARLVCSMTCRPRRRCRTAEQQNSSQPPASQSAPAVRHPRCSPPKYLSSDAPPRLLQYSCSLVAHSSPPVAPVARTVRQTAGLTVCADRLVDEQ